MQEPRHYHSTSLLLPDGRVLVSGGGRFGPNFPTAEIYSPPYLFKGARPVITSTPPVIQYNAHFTVVTGDAPRIARVALLRLGSVTHGFDENQRYVELAFTPVAGGLDVTGSTSANIVLPGHYMLFLVDTNGVPSVASIVRFPAPWEDGIPPTAPTNLAATTAPGRVDLTWSAATDNSGVALYNIHRGTLPGVTPSPANRVGQSATTSFRDTGFASGAYYYVVTAQDAGGNVGPASNETGLVAQADVTAPVVAVTAPTSGAMLSGLVTIAANATDDIGVAGVQFLLDGAALQAEDTTAPYAVDWNTNLAANGAHTLSARARDARGNTTDAANVGVTASNTTIAGLVAAYSFGEGTGGSVADSTGNGNTGTITNATWTTSGKFGNALVFNGTNAKVTIPDASALDLTTAMTLEAWVYPTTTPTNWSTILHKEIDRYYIAAGSNTGAPAVGGTFTSGNTNLYGAAPMTANVWTHVAATYDGTTLILYLNGNPVSSKAVAGSLTVSGSPVSIGGTAAYGEFFTGRIDEVRIYNRALTQAQVQQDMAQPVP
jgi:hypothetical protein